ncbi:unnamed protein product, partial [Didymodactylos carnosus]
MFDYDNVSISTSNIDKMPAVVIHFVPATTGPLGSLHEYNKRELYQNINYKQMLTVFYESTAFDVVYLQMFPDRISNPYGLYYLIVLLNATNRQWINDLILNTTVVQQNYCPNVQEILNSTVMKFSRLRRIKYYQKPCRENIDLVCFYDEQYFCLCDQTHDSECFYFDHNIQKCAYCENDGICINDNEKNPLNYVCICP